MDLRTPDREDPPPSRVFRAVFFVASAAIAAAFLRFAYREPWLFGAAFGLFLLLWLSRWQSRRRLRRVLRSGDVAAVLRSVAGAFDRMPYPATMAPIMTATAFAACGWIDRARAVLATAERGPAWEAAIEHRLFLDTLLLAFEGDSDSALVQARRLNRLPLAAKQGAMRERVLGLRAAAAAFARAFAHKSEPGDVQLLLRTSEASPLVFWAMRYAAAVISIDLGQNKEAERLLKGAPSWPKESIFSAFHEEIQERVRSSRPA